MLGRLERIDADWKAISLELARRLLKEPQATRTADLVRNGGALVAPQSILILLKLALRHAQKDSGEVNAGLVLGSLLAIQQVTMAPDESGDARSALEPAGSLFREIVSNQSFAVRPTEASLITRLQVRWNDLLRGLTMDPQYVDLPGEFARVTGTTIDDLTAIGIALWARSVEHPGVPFPVSYLASFKWTPERRDAALALIVADAPTLLTGADRGDDAFGVPWSFDAFRQYPVMRLAGDRLVVISPSFLLLRLFGWLPLYDLQEGLQRLEELARWDRIHGFFGTVCEVQALETLAATIGETPLLRRLYRQGDLQSAFGADKKTADAVIDYGDAWVVVEVSTHQLTRPAAVGGRADALERDFRIGVIEKVEQLHSTIGELLADESRLTRAASVPRRRILAVLVCTEGFPINPMTYIDLERRISEAGLLSDPRVGPLHILDQEELEMIEGVAEHQGRSLLQLLEAHEHGNLYRMGFREWLLTESNLCADRPSRLEGPLERGWAVALKALGETAEDTAG